MSTASWWELLIMIPAATFGAYALIWSIPGVIFGAILSLEIPNELYGSTNNYPRMLISFIRIINA